MAIEIQLTLIKTEHYDFNFLSNFCDYLELYNLLYICNEIFNNILIDIT